MNRWADGTPRAGAGLRATSLALLGVFVLQGCYSVTTVEPGALQPGSRVVASLTAEGSQQLAAQVGPRVVAVEGVLDQATPSQLSLRLVRTEGTNQVSTFWNQEEVIVPRPVIAQLSERRLNRPRSFLVAGMIVGGALLAATLAGGVLTGDGGDGPDPSPVN
ncbi:MAG TPA: hypothetical protein VEX86_03115 [Longimicrobium sp.]|nr:hypothetical protein [Longimicrobium sp.]